MAEYCDIYRDRESSVYVQPEIEGHLEKKPSGVFRTKTTRRWCWVQGSIFYQQKPNPGSGPGEIEVNDMSEAQWVRKVSADPTETQFEIVFKKTNVFVCPTREECNAWIKALQTAMARKNSGQPNRSMFYTPSTLITSALTCPGGSGEDRNGFEENNIYAVPQDTLYPEVTNTGNGNHEENIYSELTEIQSNQNSAQTDFTPNGASPHTNTKTPPLPPRSDVAPKPDAGELYGDCYSSTESPAQSVCDTSDVYSEAYSSSTETRPGEYTKKAQESGKVSSPGWERAPSKSGIDPDETALKTSEVDEENDPVEFLFEALDDRTSPVCELEHVLTEDDVKPLKGLKAFLKNNDIRCRFSTNRLSESQDPITACRSYLSTLDSMM